MTRREVADWTILGMVTFVIALVLYAVVVRFL